MTTKAQMGQILGVLGVAYRRQALTTQELKLAVPVWHELLGDLDFDLLKAAVHSHCASSKWFPSVAELRQAAYDLVAPDAEGVTAGEAWGEVKRAIALGSHRFQSGEAHWSSPLVEAAFNALGGWNYFRTALVDSEMADRAHFTRAYEGLQRQQVHDARMHPAARRFRQERLGEPAQLTGAADPECHPGEARALDQLGRLAHQLSLNRLVPSVAEGPALSKVEGPVPSPAEGPGPSPTQKKRAKQVPVP